MANLFDELQMGTVSQRRLLELLSAGCGSAALGAAQDGKNSLRRLPKISPANIGGGGRIERDFYRRWTKTSKGPMIEGYSILDASMQEVQSWPEVGGRGLYLDFSDSRRHSLLTLREKRRVSWQLNPDRPRDPVTHGRS